VRISGVAGISGNGHREKSDLHPEGGSVHGGKKTRDCLPNNAGRKGIRPNVKKKKRRLTVGSKRQSSRENPKSKSIQGRKKKTLE